MTYYVTTRYSWKDKENIQDWYDKYAPGSVSKETMDSDLEATNKFLHEMRATRAYGYETVPRFFNFPYMELARDPGYVEDNYYEAVIKETADVILAHISERTGRPYEPVDVVKLLWSNNWLMLATIEAKESVPDSVIETFHAAVSCRDNKVLECFLKPDEDALPIYAFKRRKYNPIRNSPIYAMTFFKCSLCGSTF